MRLTRRVVFAVFGLALACAAWDWRVLAGEADIVEVKVSKLSAGLFRFDVTVAHADQGWNHYADKWDIVAPDGRVLGTRILLHPHEDEQPFTRSHDIAVPAEIDKVKVRAHDKVHGYGGREMTVTVPH